MTRHNSARRFNLARQQSCSHFSSGSSILTTSNRKHLRSAPKIPSDSPSFGTFSMGSLADGFLRSIQRILETLATNREEETLVHVRCCPELQNTSMKSIQFFILWGGNNDRQPSGLHMKSVIRRRPLPCLSTDHVFPGTVGASEPPAERAKTSGSGGLGPEGDNGTLVFIY